MIPVVLPISHTSALETEQGYGLQAESQTGPLTWVGRATGIVVKSSSGEVTCTSTQHLRPEGLQMSCFLVAASFVFFSIHFDEMIKEYLGDSSESQWHLFFVY